MKMKNKLTAFLLIAVLFEQSLGVPEYRFSFPNGEELPALLGHNNELGGASDLNPFGTKKTTTIPT